MLLALLKKHHLLRHPGSFTKVRPTFVKLASASLHLVLFEQSHLFIFIIAGLLFTASAFSEIRVAFWTTRDGSGKPIQLEKGGKYTHIAIAFEGKWLHSSPKNGVELVDEVEGMGKIADILVDVEGPPLDPSVIKDWLGLPYDPTYDWGNKTATYCSKLVGLLLGIEPQPMLFDSDVWNSQNSLPRGTFGLSPDDIYRILIKRGYLLMSTPHLCERIVTSQK